MQLPRYSGQGSWLGEAVIYILSDIQAYGSAQLPEWGYRWVKTRLQGQYGYSFEPLNQAYLCHMEFPNQAVSPFAKEQRCWLGLPFKQYRLECTLPRSECWLFQLPSPSPLQSDSQWSRHQRALPPLQLVLPPHPSKRTNSLPCSVLQMVSSPAWSESLFNWTMLVYSKY